MSAVQTPHPPARDDPALLRRAALFTLALWGRRFTCRLAGDANQGTAYVKQDTIYLPASTAWRSTDSNLYRAAAAHGAAHLCYGGARLAGANFKPRQRILIELFEDARVEARACGEFPGLRRLWLNYHIPPAPGAGLVNLMRQLSRALLNPAHLPDDSWVHKGVELFRAAQDRLDTPDLALELGLQLANDLGQMRIPANEADDLVLTRYRDDNRHLWHTETELTTPAAVQRRGERIAQTTPFLREMGTGPTLELAGNPGPSAQVASAWLRNEPAQARLEYRQPVEGSRAKAFRYPEWDYRLERQREDWCSIQAFQAAPGAEAVADRLLARHRPTRARLQRLVRWLRLEQRRPVRRQYQGDELDLDAVVCARVDAHAGREPDLRIYRRMRALHDRGLASLLLLDLSESLNDRLDTGTTLMDILRETALLTGEMMTELGEAFAIDGFHSNGRHRITYYSFKGMETDYDAGVRAAIAGAHGACSTRMGPALRHATHRLLTQPQQRRLLLMVTDGAPSDTDVYDHRYLLEDARHAVQSARSAGVAVFAVSLDPNADNYLTRIFGRDHYLVVQDPVQLPERLPQMFMKLIRHY